MITLTVTTIVKIYGKQRCHYNYFISFCPSNPILILIVAVLTTASRTAVVAKQAKAIAVVKITIVAILVAMALTAATVILFF